MSHAVWLYLYGIDTKAYQIVKYVSSETTNQHLPNIYSTYYIDRASVAEFFIQNFAFPNQNQSTFGICIIPIGFSVLFCFGLSWIVEMTGQWYRESKTSGKTTRSNANKSSSIKSSAYVLCNNKISNGGQPSMWFQNRRIKIKSMPMNWDESKRWGWTLNLYTQMKWICR